MPKSTKSPLALTTGPISIDDVVAVARQGRRITVSPKSVAAMKRSRRVVEACLTDGEPHYGINTGFGSLAKQRIGPADLRTLQRNLIRSHTAGVGEPLREELVRAMMLCLAASLARGLSGVRPIVVDTIVAMLNKGVTPVVPSIGSVGASGDLAPLAAVALAAIGEGNSTYHGRRMSGAAALKAAGIKPLTLEAKEGLALINGTHLMCGEGALLTHDAAELHAVALIVAAMSIDACRASHTFLTDSLYAARNHFGALAAARAITAHLRGGRIAASHVANDPRVQDPYSLRAAPTVLGAVEMALAEIDMQIAAELGAVTDNPLVFSGTPVDTDTARLWGVGNVASNVISGANFHGMPIALPLDYLAIALCHLAGISERRTYLMTGAFEPESHLKPFLAPKPGLQSGLMIAQYTAAACVNEMIGLATPATVSNIPTCAGMEDYNSWGPRAAAKARRSLELARRVIAVEMLCAAQGVEQHRPLKSGRGVESAIKIIRRKVKTLTDDRPLTDDIEAIASLIADGAFTATANQ